MRLVLRMTGGKVWCRSITSYTQSWEESPSARASVKTITQASIPSLIFSVPLSHAGLSHREVQYLLASPQRHDTFSTPPPLSAQSVQLPGYSPTFPPNPLCRASCAAALLLTPLLQKKTTSSSSPGRGNPYLSSNSSGERKKASAEDFMGMFLEVGIVPVDWSSEGSRTSIRMRLGDGEEERRAMSV